MFSCSSACEVNACIEIGTSCMLWSRRCAVTVISWIESLPVSASAVVAAAAAAAEAPPRITAIA
jgi:hypothetical protein